VARLGSAQAVEVRRCTTPALIFAALLVAAGLDANRSEPAGSDACGPGLRSAIPTGPPLMTLRTRAHEVAVYPGSRLAFTVLDHQGFVLAERIDDAAFAEAFPELHEQLESAFAREQPWLDATAPARRDGTAAAGP
jgi:hypothetical protein